MNRAAKFLRLSPGDQWLLVEASLFLLVSRAVLRLMPFRWIARAVSRPPAMRPLDGEAARALVERVRWAVRAGASTLYYGVANSATRDLEAHVWVRAGSLDVVGCESADRFKLLVSFPREAASPAR
jgi:hypothetical protein